MLLEASSQAGTSGGRNGDQLLVELESLPHLVGLDGDVALVVDELGAEGMEERAGGIDGVGGLAKADAEREAALVAGLRRLQEGVQRPVIGLGRGAGRIHRLHVDAGVLFHQVDAGAGALDLAADGGGNAEPLAV